VIALRHETARSRRAPPPGRFTVDLEDGTDAPNVDLNCVSGTVIVRAPQDANIDVDMSTMSGRTVTTFRGLGTAPFLGSGFPFGGKNFPLGKPQKLNGRLAAGPGASRRAPSPVT